LAREQTDSGNFFRIEGLADYPIANVFSAPPYDFTGKVHYLTVSHDTATITDKIVIPRSRCTIGRANTLNGQ